MVADVVTIDGDGLTIEKLMRVARGSARVKLAEEAGERVAEASRLVERWVSEGEVIYGVTTGFGPLANRIIPPGMARELQRNLIRSHSAGVGPSLPAEAVRGTMLLRANCLAKGNSGIRPGTLKTLIEMINSRIHPLVPEVGSVGASGDLNPLAHIALVMMGEGKAEYKGEILDAQKALKKGGVGVVDLGYKEGLALINGTCATTALAAIAVHDAERLCRVEEVAAAMGLEALKGAVDALDERIHNLKPHPGQKVTAQNIRRLIKGSRLVRSRSEIIKAFKEEKKSWGRGEIGESKVKIQDAYTLRCAPQILGAVREALGFARRVVEVEMNSVTDNPIIFPKEGEVVYGGNFHAQEVAMAMDFLSIALAEMGNISERRLARLLDPDLNEGLPPFLISANEGLRSGFMGLQYAATSLMAESWVLASPISTNAIPTNANNQDIVSMGCAAALKARRVLGNVRYVVAIEVMCAAQALELRGLEGLGRGTRKAYEVVRRIVPPLTEDRVLHGDIERMAEMVGCGVLLEEVEREIGDLA